MVNIAILDSEKVSPKFDQAHGSFSQIFRRLLQVGGLDISSNENTVTTYQVLDSPENFPSLDIDSSTRPDVVLITGSTRNSYDDEPWILEMVEFIQKCLGVHPTVDLQLEKPIKVIGVCFGHQVLGRALGAKVGPNPKDWELGIHPVHLTKTGIEVFGEFKDSGSFNLMEFHRDIVFELPKGLENIEVIGKTDICDFQGFYKKDHLWTIQGHPEFDQAIEMELLTYLNRKNMISNELYEDAIKRVDLRNDGAVLAKSMVRFITE